MASCKNCNCDCYQNGYDKGFDDGLEDIVTPSLEEVLEDNRASSITNLLRTTPIATGCIANMGIDFPYGEGKTEKEAIGDLLQKLIYIKQLNPRYVLVV